MSGTMKNLEGSPANQESVVILHLEDDVRDAELVKVMLQKAGLNPSIHRVDSKEQFVQLLEERPFDLILSDYSMPVFDGEMALELARESHPEIPFIFMSGTLGEERAVEALHAGATDYVLKTKPKRLVPAIQRALKEVKQAKEKNNFERQFLQLQKMECIGRLTAGIAHDFNNMLSVILGVAELVLADLKPGDPIRTDLEEILKAGQRAASLTRQLLMFSRQHVQELRVMELNELLVNMDKMLHHVLEENVEMASKLSPVLGKIRADASSLEQVVMNLAVNARDAMPTGGRLTMETFNVMLDEVAARDHPDVKPGRFIQLSVSDTGIGMDQATQARIFEPFFTTKEKGKGTGLGLSTVFGIVKQSGGHIEIESEVGHGTTFKIFLPRVEGEITHVTPSSALATLRGSETVLLVDDEDVVRAVARSILKRYGYIVLEARHGAEALLMVKKHPRKIDLLLTDIVMPHMSGPELAKRLSAVGPNMKVLYISGYVDEAVSRHGMGSSTTPFLQKPLSVETLTKKVREVLDQTP